MTSVLKNKGPRAVGLPRQMVREMPDEVQNNAGGYVNGLDIWKQLQRFLILGVEGGTYYVSERKLAESNIVLVKQCMISDPLKVVQMAAEVLAGGKALKTEPALYVLAEAASWGIGNKHLEDRFKGVRLAAFKAAANLRTTEFFQFIDLADEYRGWGRGIRTFISKWYNRPVQQIAYQMVKYRQRNGRTHRDTLRQAHPVPVSKAHNDLFRWAVAENDANAAFLNGEYAVAAELRNSVLVGYEMAKRAKTSREVVRLVEEYGLDWEMLPTQWLTEKLVWQALITKMKPWAMLRNLGRMTALGVFDDKFYLNLVVQTLTSPEIIKRERLHPIRSLVGHVGYQSGHGRAHGDKQLTWRPLSNITQAIEKAMYLGFDTIVPSGKRVHFAMDISGSMGMGSVCGVDGLTPMMASAIMMMATLRSEKDVYVSGFTTAFEPVNVTKQSTLSQVIKEMERLSRRMGATDCAKPMLWSADQARSFDAFVITTDNETWAGNVKPPEALRRYRELFVPDARLVVVGMTATGFSIADPKDPLSLDVVGMSTDTPSVVSRFIAGEF